MYLQVITRSAVAKMLSFGNLIINPTDEMFFICDRRAAADILSFRREDAPRVDMPKSPAVQDWSKRLGALPSDLFAHTLLIVTPPAGKSMPLTLVVLKGGYACTITTVRRTPTSEDDLMVDARPVLETFHEWIKFSEPQAAAA